MFNFISLQLLVQASLAISIPVIENGMGENKLGPEMMITDFAVLTLNNPDVNLPSDFTICSSVSSDTFLGFLSPFQLVHQDGTPWISVRIEPAQKDSRRHRMIFFVSIDFKSFSQGLKSFQVGSNVLASANTEIPLLPLQWIWLHSCVAISCDQSHMSVVVNGIKVLEAKIPQKEMTPCPTSLGGTLLLQKTFINTGYWSQNRGRVTNVNIFHGLTSLARMVATTSGEDCGKQNGDILAWTNSSWSLQGAARWTEVSVEELCRDFSTIQLFTTQRVSKPDDCRHLCRKVHGEGRMTSVETPELLGKLQSRLRSISPKLGSAGPMVVWLPISREKGLWLDNYTNKTITAGWNQGFPVDDANKKCAILPIRSPGFTNQYCTHTAAEGGFYCSCYFPKHPFLTLRGLCKDSYLDQTYLPQNSPKDGETTFYGNRKSSARFLKDDIQWKIETFVYNTTAVSKEISGRFMLGKQIWRVEGDSKKCQDGRAYDIKLKLTGCEEGEFTCDNGQCIKMEERCNQLPDCRDESDERGCRVVILKEGYNRKIPPIAKRLDGSVIPVEVSISVTLMKVVEIEETDHSIHLQFQISLQWKENRVKYLNLKHDTALNALTDEDIKTLWLPLILYDNTDQKEVTRLGEYGNGEWMTFVTVSREGNFTRSGFNEVDEAEIFEGAENRLTMNQTYTWEFQCNYRLQRYPFDTQVHLNV